MLYTRVMRKPLCIIIETMEEENENCYTENLL